MAVVSYSRLIAGRGIEDSLIERVNVTAPWNWQPTDQSRGWITDPFTGIGVAGIFGALFPAFMLYLLFFIDHNISSILTQSPKFNLKKPPAFHWDFFVLGLTIVPCAIMGLPPGSGLIPQAPLHTRALATRKVVVDENTGIKKEVTVHVEEQRWSALLQASMMFLALALFTVISTIPKGALFGVFLYLGVGAMHGNEVWAHFSLNFVLAKKRPQIPIVKNVNWRTVQLFTALQIVCAAIIFGVAQFASVGYIFPALVTALVPLRSWVVSRMFSAEDLKYLDPVSETQEEIDEEKRAYHERRPSMDSADIDIANVGLSDFRAAGYDFENKKEHDMPVPAAASSAEEGASTLVQRKPTGGSAAE